jgi:hypothetical protein
MPDDTPPVVAIPATVRFSLYVISAMLAAFYVVATQAIELAWYWQAAYAAWNAGVGVLAAANTKRATTEDVP